MTITKEFFEAYKKARYGACSLPYFHALSPKQALIHIKSDYENRLNAWRYQNGLNKYIFHGDRIDLPDGYYIELRIEYDDFPFHEDIKHQGYIINLEESRHATLPDFYYEHGAEFQRDYSGDLQFCIPFSVDRDSYHAVGYLPLSWCEQFTNKGDSRNARYVNMIDSAKQAVKADIDMFLGTDYYRIGASLYNAKGKEIESVYLGGCDENYATSGKAFFEDGMIETLKDAAKTDYAMHNPLAISENYQFAAGI